jgi:hypothetical protein
MVCGTGQKLSHFSVVIDHYNSFRLLLWPSFHGWLMTIVFILKVTTMRCHTIKLGNVLL